MSNGKGLCLSDGGFRASLYHIGMHLASIEVKLILSAIFRQLKVERVNLNKPVQFKKVPIWDPKGKFELRFSEI